MRPESKVLPDRNRADDQAYREHAVEDPVPILVAKSSQQQEEEDEMEPGPYPAHPLEVAKETVCRCWREESGERGGNEKCHQRPEDRLASQVKRLSPESERQDERGSSYLDDDAEENVPRSHVRKEEVRPDNQWNQQRYEQQRDDRGAPGELR